MLRVDVGADTTVALCLRDNMEREGRLAGGFRTEDLDNATARQTTDAEREVE